MKPSILLITLTTSACVTGGPLSLCNTVSSERITPRESLAQLDGVSLNDWFDDVEAGLTWDIRWTDIDDAPSEDALTLTLERRGRPLLEEIRPLRPETADTPEDLRAGCLDGPHVRTEVRVVAQTNSGATGTSDGELILLGPDLASAILALEVPLSGPAWLMPNDERPACVGDPIATLGFGPQTRLDAPLGFVSVRYDNCTATWGEWSAMP